MMQLMLVISLGLRVSSAWEKRHNWMELGYGECRPRSCSGGCSHTWTERSTCTCSLEECLDFAKYGDSRTPAADNFITMPGKTFNGASIQQPRTSNGRNRWDSNFNQAVAYCNSMPACTGFTCNSWGGRCTRFFSSEPIGCGTVVDGYPVGCWDGEVSFWNVYPVTTAVRPALAAVTYDGKPWCSQRCLYYSSYKGYAAQCTAFDQLSSGPDVPATGVAGGTFGICYRSTSTESPQEETGVAISMTDASGQALDILSMETKIAMYGPFGLVSVHFRFKNTQWRRIEGRFRYLLPSQAAVQRLAMKIRGLWMEGEVVERKRARQIWRELLLEQRDPALLEQEQGNVYSLKIFPINSQAEVEVALTYSVLSTMSKGARRLTIPMVGLPEVTILKTLVVLSLSNDENVTVATGPRGELQHTTSVGAGLIGYEQLTEGVPSSDITIEVTGATQAQSTSVRAGKYVATWHVLGNDTVGTPAPRSQGGTWSFYVDTSASVADVFVARQVMLQQFFNHFANKTGTSTCNVLAFDMNVTVLVTPGDAVPAASLGEHIRTLLQQRLPLGLTRLDRVLEHIAANAPDFAVLVTDAIATHGTRGAQLQAALTALPNSTRLYIVSFGAKIDRAAASEIAGLGGGRIVIVSLTADVGRAKQRMSTTWDELLAPVGFTGTTSSSSDVQPSRFFDLKPGSEVAYFTWNVNQAPDFEVGGRVLPAPTASTLHSAFLPLLFREGVRAELSVLERHRSLQTNSTQRASIETAMVDLSTRNRVLCSLTALLVLETEADYERFGVARNARNDVLEITNNGIALQKPSAPQYDIEVKDFEENASAPTDLANRNAKAPGEVASRASSAVPQSLQGLAGVAAVCSLSWVSGGGAFFVLGLLLAPLLLSSAVVMAIGFKALMLLAGCWHWIFFLGLLSLVLAVTNSSIHGRCTQALAALDGSRSLPPRQRPPSSSCLVLALTVCAIVALQGCASEYDDDCCYWSREWRNVSQWAEGYLKGHKRPTGRNRLEASLYSEALAVLGRADELRGFTADWLMWDPANPQVYEQLGFAALTLSDHSTAIRSLVSLAEVASSNPEMLLRAAWLSLKAGELELAQDLAQQAIVQREDNPNAYRALGIARFLRGDHAGTRAAYGAARWRLTQQPKCCARRWGGDDQAKTPVVLAAELSYLDSYAGNTSMHGVVFDGSCHSHGCQSIDSINDCELATSALGIPLGTSGVITQLECSLQPDDYCDSDGRPAGSFSPACMIDQDGYVKLKSQLQVGSPSAPGLAVATAKTPLVCFCYATGLRSGNPSMNSTVSVVMSWIGDGNNVDLFMRRVKDDGEPETGGDVDQWHDVRQGLGPEMLQVHGPGRFEIGVFYSWAAAMGSARGVITVWSQRATGPLVLPFALPIEDSHSWEIVSVGFLSVTAKGQANLEGSSVTLG